MGEVWHGIDLTLNRPVAVKLLQTGQASAADTQRFRLEAQTAARLNHPNVVGVYDFGSHQGRHYLVMEPVDGQNLAEELQQLSVLDCREAAAIAAQIAAGLAAAHRQRVIHRDIKPGNVMVTTDRTVKITDFGIARFADEATSTLTAAGKIIGSAAYLPPERALGRPAQLASDVYSLGCVLYELLTGRPPFTGETTLAVVQQHVDAAPVPPTQLCPDIPAPLAGYVLLMLAKDPTQRPTAEQAAARLDKLTTPHEPSLLPDAAPTTPLAVPPPPVTPPTTPSASGRPRRKVSLKALLALALFATALAVGASLASSSSRSSTPPASTTTAPVTIPTPTTFPSSSISTTSAPPTAEGDTDNKDREDKHDDHKGKGHGHKD